MLAIAISTLWSEKECIKNLIAKDLMDAVNVIGNSYNKINSIKPIIVNILGNRNIRYILICGIDKDNVANSLVFIFKNGDLNNLPDELEEVKNFILEARKQIIDVIVCNEDNLNSTIKQCHENLIKENEFNENYIDCANILEVKASYYWMHIHQALLEERKMYIIYL